MKSRLFRDDHDWRNVRELLVETGLQVNVGTGDQLAANRLYRSLGFKEERRGCYWRKRL
ncbi:hypothetical protein H8E52_02935 [bacterium]|nr:hypothetical protein [bacterium]